MIQEQDYAIPSSMEADVVLWEPDPWEEPIDWDDLEPWEEYPE